MYIHKLKKSDSLAVLVLVSITYFRKKMEQRTKESREKYIEQKDE